MYKILKKKFAPERPNLKFLRQVSIQESYNGAIKDSKLFSFLKFSKNMISATNFSVSTQPPFPDRFL